MCHEIVVGVLIAAQPLIRIILFDLCVCDSPHAIWKKVILCCDTGGEDEDEVFSSRDDSVLPPSRAGWGQFTKRFSYDAKFLFIPLKFWPSVLLSALYTAGSDGIPITSQQLVLTSSLVITTDHRLQADCFQALTGFNKCGTAADSYSQKHVRKNRYSVSFGSVHSARAGFPTPKQELTLLERDFLLVLCLRAQIGI